MKSDRWLVSIDPGSNALGAAVFLNGRLHAVKTITAPKKNDSYMRSKHIVSELMVWLDLVGYDTRLIKNHEAASEDPLLRGHAQTIIQRLLGQLEFLFPHRMYYYAPTAVKKAMGKGTLDKPEVKKAVIEKLNEAEAEELNGLDTFDYDAYDAIAVGLTHLRR